MIPSPFASPGLLITNFVGYVFEKKEKVSCKKSSQNKNTVMTHKAINKR